ncbi:MAG: hypothetical protein ABJE95_20860 [Byssovorax sp.]
MSPAPSAPEAAVDPAHAGLSPAAWDVLTRWIKLYSWAQVLFLAILVGSLHVFPILGMHWSSCLVHDTTDWWCVLFFHLYEIPFVVLFAYHAYVGFTQVTRAKLPYYTFLTLFQLVMLVVFLTFESKTMIDGLTRQVASWQIITIFAGCVGMIINSILGCYVVFARVVPAYLAGRGES